MKRVESRTTVDRWGRQAYSSHQGAPYLITPLLRCNIDVHGSDVPPLPAAATINTTQLYAVHVAKLCVARKSRLNPAKTEVVMWWCGRRLIRCRSARISLDQPTAFRDLDVQVDTKTNWIPVRTSFKTCCLLHAFAVARQIKRPLGSDVTAANSFQLR